MSKRVVLIMALCAASANASTSDDLEFGAPASSDQSLSESSIDNSDKAKLLRKGVTNHRLKTYDGVMSFRASGRFARVEDRLMSKSPEIEMKRILQDFGDYTGAREDIELIFKGKVDIPLGGQTYRFRQTIDGIETNSSMSIKVEPDGSVSRLKALVVEPDKVEPFSIKKDDVLSLVKQWYSVNHLYNDTIVMASDLPPDTRRSNNLSDAEYKQYYQFTDDYSVAPYWHVKVHLIQPPVGATEFYVHAVSGEVILINPVENAGNL